MPIDATCPHCSQTFQVPDSAAGKRFKCRNCSKPMDVPTAEEIAAAKAAPADDELEIDEIEDDEEEADDEADADADDESDDDDADEDADEDEDSDDDASDDEDEDSDDDEGDKKLSARERMKAKREGKKDKKKDKADKKKDKKDKKDKGKDKAEKKASSFSVPKISVEGGTDAASAMGNTLNAIQRGLHPSRLFTAAAGVATGMFSSILLGLLLGSILPMSLWYITAYVPMLVMACIVIFAMVAVAKVDFAALAGEDVPGPIAALLGAAKGALGSIGAPILLVLAVGVIGFVLGLVGMVAKIPYAGAILAMPLLIVFFVVNFALTLGTPLSLWLVIPLAALKGNNPIAPLVEALARLKADPIRITISYILFTLFSTLILGVLMAFGFAALFSSGFQVAQHLGGLPIPGLGGMGATPEWMAGAAGRWLSGIFIGGAVSVIMGLLVGPYLSAFVCAGCQEIASNPGGDDA